MKTIRQLLAGLMACAGFNTAWAQEPYPPSVFEDSYVEHMTFEGQRPKMSDFVTHFFESDAMPEVWGLAQDAWTHYLHKEPQDKGSYLLYDERNGYMRYDNNVNEMWGDDIEHEERVFIEMCIWNCADGRHILFANNCQSLVDKRYASIQYEGITFQLYDKTTHDMYCVGHEDVGIALPDNMYGEHTVLVYLLPQGGKDITLLVQREAGTETKVLRWDGMRFHLGD
ncbi:MAG: hypothetical protein IKX59_08300 [Bacteroidales bacterium]|nr:hypothetical protein [Bacteroidales bacterium]